MTRFIPPILIGSATGAADVASRLIEQQPVGVTTALTIACFAGSACLWLAGKFSQRDAASAEIALALAKSNDETHQRLAAIERAVKDLPCTNGKGPKGKSSPCE